MPVALSYLQLITSELPVIQEEYGNSRDPSVLNASYVGGIVGSEFILSFCLKAPLAMMEGRNTCLPSLSRAAQSIRRRSS